mmetsp:Transcript_42581/g.83952  ORF Transcript_42581/g.83952 Transcript_42581/m.83952 type:complete len:97 (+) Transcript_42581:632-922(+)
MLHVVRPRFCSVHVASAAVYCIHPSFGRGEKRSTLPMQQLGRQTVGVGRCASSATVAERDSVHAFEDAPAVFVSFFLWFYSYSFDSLPLFLSVECL